jgi:hypothetical protein
MKNIRIFGIIFSCILIFGLGMSDLQAKTKAGKQKAKTAQAKQEAVSETNSVPDVSTQFVVKLKGADCAALQHCNIVIVLYTSYGAEIGSAQYVYPQATYYFNISPPAVPFVCASLQVTNCAPGYNITPTPGCVAGPFNPNTSYPITVGYTCN